MIVVIPSFVIFFSNTSFQKNRLAKIDFGSINGRPITREEFIEAKQEIRLEYFFNRGTLPETDEQTTFNVNRDTYFRLHRIPLVGRTDTHAGDAQPDWKC